MDTAVPAAPGRPGGDADLAAAATLIADPARARVLLALLDGRALPASGLAAEAGLSAPATTAHLNKLRAGGLIEVEASGRHRYYRLTGPHVATVLEALATIVPLQPIRSLRQDTHAGQLRAARSCYDHLAGRLCVAVTAALLNRRVLTVTDGIDDTIRRSGDRLAAALPAHPYNLRLLTARLPRQCPWSHGFLERTSAEDLTGDRRSKFQRYLILLREWPVRRLGEDHRVSSWAKAPWTLGHRKRERLASASRGF